jgi:hypothetical protein
VKIRGARQTVCDEPGATPKMAFCGGKLKMITTLDPEAAEKAGKGHDVFRCQVCGTLYSETSPYAALQK